MASEGAGERRYVALLRGVNLGRAARVAMADLRALVDELGYRDARTVLNSGNVAFSGPQRPLAAIADALESALAARLGVRSRVIVLTAEDLGRVLAENPLLDRATDHARLVVAIPRDPSSLARVEPLIATDRSPEVLALGSRAAYVWTPAGVSGSTALAAVGNAIGEDVTTRNWATMLKLAAVLGG